MDERVFNTMTVDSDVGVRVCIMKWRSKIGEPSHRTSEFEYGRDWRWSFKDTQVVEDVRVLSLHARPVSILA